jgi:hypothetical protein
VPEPLATSPIGRESSDAIARLLRERADERDREFWLAIVPGTSEQWGHHRAPPRDVEQRGAPISAEFVTRLHHAYRLLEHDVVRFVLVSGGSIDRTRPDYNEALRGRETLVAMFGARWPRERGPLFERILVDPIAEHSTTNLRNADKLAVDLGLDRLLIATTMPPTPYLWPVFLPIVHQTSQGWYFLHHRVSTFDWRCRRQLGYALGRFDWFAAPRGTESLRAIAHHGWDVDRLRADRYGP